MSMRHLCMLLLSLAAAVLGGEEPKDEKPRRVEARQQHPAWLTAIDRLRSQPLPGEIVNGGINADINTVFDLPSEERKKVAQWQDAYAAELLQRAAKWEEELKVLRAQYEAKLLALLPETRRQVALQLLELSHTHWVSRYEREEKVDREFLEFKNAQPPPKNAEEQREFGDACRQWLAQRRRKQREDEAAVVKKLYDMLSPVESARMAQLDRSQMHGPQEGSVKPQPAPKPENKSK